MTRDVATEAASGILFRLSVKSENELLRCRDLRIVAGGRFDRLEVSFAGSVATFAAGAVLRVLWRGFGMHGL